jgi:hypothetical protein
MPTISLQSINLGGYANDGTGDDLRTAFAKVIANFQTIKDAIPSSLAEDTSPTLGGDLDLNGFDLNSDSLVTLDAPGLTVTGPVTATNFVGQISDISNHNLDALADVIIEEPPIAGESLVYDGSIWRPGAVSATFATVDGGSSSTIYNLEDGAVIDGGNA